MQPAPGPEASRRRLLAFSLGLNVVCALLLAFTLRRPGRMDDTVSPSGAEIPRAVAPSIPKTGPVRPRPNSPDAGPAPTPWSLLVSADLQEYARNLSQAGFPPETVCDILIPESRRVIHSQPDDAGPPGGFWVAGNQRAALQRSRQTRRAALQRSRSELLADLSCRDFGRDEEPIQVDLVTRMLAGSLSAERRSALVDLLLDQQRFDEEWKIRTRGVVLPDDLRLLADESARLSARLGSLVSANEFEEICLRAAALGDSLFRGDMDADAAAAIRLTPSEFRELFRRAYLAGENELEQAVHLEFRVLGEDPPKRPDSVRLAEYREVLGTARAEELRLRSSPSYDTSQEWVKQFGADPGTPGRILDGLDQFQQEVAALAAAGRDQPDAVKDAVQAAFAAALAGLEQGLDRVTLTNRTEILRDWLQAAAQKGWSSP